MRTCSGLDLTGDLEMGGGYMNIMDSHRGEARQGKASSAQVPFRT